MANDDIQKYRNDHLSANPPKLLSEIAYERIKEAIRNSDLEPGQPLSEKQLSSLLGISRTPIRVAIQQLAQEGLIQIIPGRAVTVASLSLQEVMNVVHVRAILEPEIARLAATSISAGPLATLWSLIEEMESALESGNRTTWAAADSKFHEILSSTCPNKLLGEMALQVRNRISFLSLGNPTDHKRLLACTAEHHQVVSAIADHNPEAAERSMREHLDKLQDSFFDRLTHV